MLAITPHPSYNTDSEDFRTASKLLREQDYSTKANRKRYASTRHPDRDQQFRYIARQKRAFLTAGLPVISIDTKKKELIGNFQQRGRRWCREADAVNTHDFKTDASAQAVPYGLYILNQNRGYVRVFVARLGRTHRGAFVSNRSARRTHRPRHPPTHRGCRDACVFFPNSFAIVRVLWLHQLGIPERMRSAARDSMSRYFCHPRPVNGYESEYQHHLVKQRLCILKDQFPPSTWQYFHAYVVAGRDPRDVAAKFGISVGTVYTAKSKVLAPLREELAGLRG